MLVSAYGDVPAAIPRPARINDILRASNLSSASLPLFFSNSARSASVVSVTPSCSSIRLRRSRILSLAGIAAIPASLAGAAGAGAARLTPEMFSSYKARFSGLMLALAAAALALKVSIESLAGTAVGTTVSAPPWSTDPYSGMNISKDPASPPLSNATMPPPA